jgi:hypothetical protein
MSSLDLYSFVFRGVLAQDSADRDLRDSSGAGEDVADRIAQRMPLDLMDTDFVVAARKMALIYVAIAAFENSVRKFIQDRFLEEVGASWWTTNVPKGIQDDAEKRKRDEDQIRWHGARGSSMIFYAQMGDLALIIQNNFAIFENHIQSVEWARQIFKSLERSRNVIMHSGELSMNDIERVAMNIRDWIRQIGG